MKRHTNEFMRTGFANCGRIAGSGIIEDNYGDEAHPGREHHGRSSLCFSLHTKEELERLFNPPVIIIQPARKKIGQA